MLAVDEGEIIVAGIVFVGVLELQSWLWLVD